MTASRAAATSVSSSFRSSMSFSAQYLTDGAPGSRSHSVLSSFKLSFHNAGTRYCLVLER